MTPCQSSDHANDSSYWVVGGVTKPQLLGGGWCDHVTKPQLQRKDRQTEKETCAHRTSDGEYINKIKMI